MQADKVVWDGGGSASRELRSPGSFPKLGSLRFAFSLFLKIVWNAAAARDWRCLRVCSHASHIKGTLEQFVREAVVEPGVNVILICGCIIANANWVEAGGKG